MHFSVDSSSGAVPAVTRAGRIAANAARSCSAHSRARDSRLYLCVEIFIVSSCSSWLRVLVTRQVVTAGLYEKKIIS